MRRWSFGQGARLAEAVDDDVLIFVYKEEYLDEVDYLRVYARRLRDKLGDDPEKRVTSAPNAAWAAGSCVRPESRPPALGAWRRAESGQPLEPGRQGPLLDPGTGTRAATNGAA